MPESATGFVLVLVVVLVLKVYFVTRGQGQVFDGERRLVVAAGSLLFVAAGQTHRFEDFSSDFTVWVVFYGPEGGELNA